MKARLFLLFLAAMILAVCLNPIIAPVAFICVFVVGALLSSFNPKILASNVGGFLSTATADTNDYVGEWQQHVLHRNGKGLNTGSTLFGLMSRLANEDAEAQTYNWWEKDPVRRTFFSTAAKLSTDTTMSFDDNASTPDTTVWTLLAAGSVLENYRTKERVMVSADPTTAVVSVTRGIKGTAGVATTAAAILENDPWILVTTGKADGADPRASSYQQPTSFQNFIQTFNATASINNAYKAGILRTDLDGPKMEAQLDALEQIANDVEIAYFFGAKDSLAGPRLMTGGLKCAIDTAGLTGSNALNGAGNSGVSLDTFTTWIQSFMTKGSDTKLGFAGPNAYSAISKYANNASGGYRIMQSGESVFGLNLTSIMTPFGELSLAAHPLFQNIGFPSLASSSDPAIAALAPGYSGWMFVIDLQLIVQKVMEPLFFQEYEPMNGADRWQGQFRAKLGLKQKFPEAFGYAYDLRKITAS